ncbi:MAG TPA: YdeI/OmpD-associated family protein [Bryobacteraceae bacterium]|nr:YdeI/OmpD-associated family protein [Bryobacteraceae bacterium]
MPPEYPTLQFASEAAFSAWLEANHSKLDGVWVQFARKGSGVPSVTYPEAVEAALCFGWIDGQAKSLDAASYLQKFTPRRKTSLWSKVNRDKAERLIASGRMRPAGLAAVEEARKNGRWDAAYSTTEEPAVWTEALAGNAKARSAWKNLDSRNRNAILFRIQTVRREETRTRKIAEFIRLLAAGDKPFPNV